MKLLKVTSINIVVIFIYKKIICRFRISKVLQSDKEIYFVNKII